MFGYRKATRMDCTTLACIIRNVEESLELQDISMSAEKKALLIVKLCALAESSGTVPDALATDRLAWMT